MENHGDFYELVRHFWWVIFPIFGMITALFQMNLRHDRYNRALDMLRSYTDQGKEPPAELLALLREQNFGMRCGTQPNWIPVFLFSGLAAGFLLFAANAAQMGVPHGLPFLFVALVMGAMAVGCLVNLLIYRNRNGNPPQ